VTPSQLEHAESAGSRHVLQLIAHAAGHSLGGAVWQISLLDQDFVYAVHVNLKADLHLRGCSVHSVRPPHARMRDMHVLCRPHDLHLRGFSVHSVRLRTRACAP
jgi:Metallo-beta-lactamase superfamily domain